MQDHDAPGLAATDPQSAQTGRVRRLLSNKKKTGWIAAAVVLVAAIGVSIGLATSHSAPADNSAASGGFSHAPTAAGGGANARSGPATGGAIGAVSGDSTSGFTLSTAGGQKVTVNETSSTTYQKGTSPGSASAITTGETVLVLGQTDSTTITATQVTVQPASSSSAQGQVVPFQRGAPSSAKQVGQIPANYTEGNGTIVSGTAANQATEAALATYPGGVVDRVVQLSSGEYEVHNIGVNWPHHVFVNQSFQVVGAE